MQWMVPLSRFGSQQKQILDACRRNDAHWIQGCAGTGKSVLLVQILLNVRAEVPEASICFVTYTHALKDLVQTGFPDNIADVPVMTYRAFENNPRRYDYIFVDEIQDLRIDTIKFLKANAERFIFAGDLEQSIFDKGASGAQITGTISPQTHKLQVLYRLTRKLREVALSILPGSLIEATLSPRIADVQVALAHAPTEDTEFQWVWAQAKSFAKVGNPTLVAFPNRGCINRFMRTVSRCEGLENPEFPNGNYSEPNKNLREAGIPLSYLGSNYGLLSESSERPLVYVMTYHSAKGLDFETVFLPALNYDCVIWSEQERAKRMLFVAITRSRSGLFLSYSGSRPHPLVARIPESLLLKIECGISEPTDQDDDFIF